MEMELHSRIPDQYQKILEKNINTTQTINITKDIEDAIKLVEANSKNFTMTSSDDIFKAIELLNEQPKFTSGVLYTEYAYNELLKELNIYKRVLTNVRMGYEDNIKDLINEIDDRKNDIRDQKNDIHDIQLQLNSLLNDVIPYYQYTIYPILAYAVAVTIVTGVALYLYIDYFGKKIIYSLVIDKNQNKGGLNIVATNKS